MLLSSIAFSLISTVTRVFINVGMVAIYSHSLSMTVFSFFALGIFVAQIVCVFIDAGVNVEIMRFSRQEDDLASFQRLADSTTVRLILGFVSVVLVSSFYVFQGEQTGNIIMLASAMCSGIMSSICETYLINIKAKNKFRAEFYIVLVQAIILFGFSLTSFWGPVSAVISVLMPRFIILYWLSLYKSKYFKYCRAVTLSLVLDYFVKLKYYSVDSIFSNLSAQLDNCLVTILLGRETYGLYQPVSRLNNAAQGLSGAIGAFVIPLASTYTLARKKWLTLNLVFSLFGFVCSAGMFFCSGFIIQNFFGKGFISDGNVIFLLSGIMLIRYVAAGSGSFLTLIGQQKQRASINAVYTLGGLSAGFGFGKDLNGILEIVMCSQLLLLFSYFVFGIVKLNKIGNYNVDVDNS